jgi:PAS domain-containing protein
MRNNWIAIYDTSPEGRLIYASESITEHTQFELDEIVGKTAYSTFHPSDHANVKNAHVQNVYNERMSSMTSYRHLCKNGNYIPIESVVICCYDLMVICNYILDENSIEHKMRVSAADEWYVCIPDGPLQKSVHLESQKYEYKTRPTMEG